MYTKHDMSISACNHRAKLHGDIAENIAEQILDISVSKEALIDSNYQDRLLEIKSCQKWIHDSANGTGMEHGRRRGRYWIGTDQHKRLIDTDGCYAFFLLDGMMCVAVKIVDAISVNKHFTGTENFQISWIHIFPELMTK